MNKKYWQNFGELNQSDAFKQRGKDEFGEDLLPLEEMDDKGFMEGKTPRRDFLKYLGFSTAAAALAASCETQVHKAVPYLNKPEDMVAGVANYYASTYVKGGDVIPVVVKQREGRPIKIEGNTESTITNGGTTAQAQASVLDLYDTTRLRHPMQADGKGYKEVSTFDAMDKMVASALAGVAGKSIVILTSTISSPTTLQIINEFIAKHPGSRHVQYDGVSYSGMLMANELTYAKRAIPSYHFDKAKVVVSLGADFLGTWISPAEFANQYASLRRVKGTNPELSRHFQFESMMSLTGANADDRFIHKPSETGAVALALLAKLGGAVSAPSLADARLNDGIRKAAEALSVSKGNALVVCGSNDVNIQVIVNAINEAIGANGTTIDWSATANYRKGVDAEMAQLVTEMNNGSVGALLVYEVNPVYNYHDAQGFAGALAKVPVSISFNGTMDETTERCKYVIPAHHWLESWGDAEPKTGYYSLIQPVISPLFKTRPFQTNLLLWMGASASAATTGKDSTSKTEATAEAVLKVVDVYEKYFRNYWIGKLGGEANFEKALRDGVVEPATAPVAASATYNGGAVAAAAAKAGTVKSGAYEVVFYQNVAMGDGSQANNPWLQELPDPISKVTWDNYALIGPAIAKQILGIDMRHQRDSDKYEVHPEKPVIKVTVNGKALSLPVLIIPGMQPATIGIALGYGRASMNKDYSVERIGRSATNAGQNAFPLCGWDGATRIYNGVATIEKTPATYPLAQTQTHSLSEGRHIFFETNLSSFIKNPEAILAEPREEREVLLADGYEDFVKDGTIYPDYAKPGIKWGMSIDMNTCIGCGACVVACNAENNISVVGKTQVQRAHEMHWMRIDRYFVGDLENPDVVFQPMLCQQCDNAPCENVCPVAATNHSSEGLNQMAYNRCIGTRYCANNCPYKVRRFNWLDYNGSDSFPNNQVQLIGVDTDPVILQMNDDLTRMVLNPDVTVRSRGVMEKCSFCVQRLQDGKLEAKKKQDPSVIRNLQTACSQACPTKAITFGNVNDKLSDVYVSREDKNRNFYVLESLHVLPNISYLAKIRNTDRNIGAEEGAPETGPQKLHH